MGPDISTAASDDWRIRSNVRSLIRRALARLVAAAFIYRAMSFLIVWAAIAAQGRSIDRVSMAAFVVLGLVNMFLAVVVLKSPRAIDRYVDSAIFLTLDIGVMLLANLWSAVIAEPGLLFEMEFTNSFWTYSTATVAVWIAFRGAKFGFGLACTIAAPLQLAMVTLNGTLEDVPLSAMATQALWTAAGFVFPTIVFLFARRGVERLIAAREKVGAARERAELFRNAHDTILQTFEGIALRLRYGREELVDRLEQIRNVVRVDADSIRTVVHSQTTSTEPESDDVTLEIQQGGQRAGVPVSITGLLEAQRLSWDTRRALVAAVEEAVRNVAKHANASRAWVSLAQRADGVHISIRDDGVGFDTGNLATTERLGLRESIVGRVRDAGGKVSVQSTPGVGTEVAITLRADGAETAGDDAAEARVTASLYAFRAASFLIAFATLSADDKSLTGVLSLPLIVSIAVANVLIGASLVAYPDRARSLIVSPPCFAIDLGVALALNLQATMAASGDVLFSDGPDLFWTYTVGAIGVWTALRGIRTGLALLGGLVPLLVFMSLAVDSGRTLAEILPVVTLRFAYAMPALAIAWLVIAMLREGRQALAEVGFQAGRQTERSNLMLSMHRSALETLHSISTRLDDQSADPEQRAARVLELSKSRATELRNLLRADFDAQRTEEPKVLSGAP